MGSKTRLSSYCTKRGDNTMNLVTSSKTIARLSRPIIMTTLIMEQLVAYAWMRTSARGCDRNFSNTFLHLCTISVTSLQLLQL